MRKSAMVIGILVLALAAVPAWGQAAAANEAAMRAQLAEAKVQLARAAAELVDWQASLDAGIARGANEGQIAKLAGRRDSARDDVARRREMVAKMQAQLQDLETEAKPAVEPALAMTNEQFAAAIKGAQVVEVIFAGHEDKRHEAMQAAAKEAVIGKSQTRRSPDGTAGPQAMVNGEGVAIAGFDLVPAAAADRRGRIIVGVDVSDESAKRLERVCAAMNEKGFVPVSVKQWLPPGDKKVRSEARKLVGGVLSDFGAALRQALPGAKSTTSGEVEPPWLGKAAFALPDGRAGVVRIAAVTGELVWRIPGSPDWWVHFPKLGLVATCRRDDAMPLSEADTAAVKGVFVEALTPLMKRERAEIRTGRW